jgi:hypothetical protein
VKSPPEETIFIPREARGKPLPPISLSVRLQRVLRLKNVRLAGDLHGRTVSEFGEYPNCGKRTLDELRELVRAVQRPHHTARETGRKEEAPYPLSAGVLFLPGNVHNLSIAELPSSVRLEGVFRRRAVSRLGDLHGVAVTDLKAMGNCGAQTIWELTRLIERAAAGEFDAEQLDWDPVQFLRTIDGLIAGLPERNREILLLRLGGRLEEVPTLKEIGRRFGLTRERVRQIVDLGVNQIRKSGSRRLRKFLEHVEKLCCEGVFPLTPALLRHWLKKSPATGRFLGSFYVRLLAELRPAIPAWPSGQYGSARRSRRNLEIESRLDAVLRRAFGAMRLSEALSRLRSRGKPSNLKAAELLAAIQGSPRFKVLFPKPYAPVVRSTRPPAHSPASARRKAARTEISSRKTRTRSGVSGRSRPGSAGP